METKTFYLKLPSDSAGRVITQLEHEIQADTAVQIHCGFEDAGTSGTATDLQLLRNGQFIQIDQGSSQELLQGTNEVTLKVSHFSDKFSGMYECSGRGASDDTRTKALLKLLLKPESAASGLQNVQQQCSPRFSSFCNNGGTCFKDSVYNTVSCGCRAGFKGLQCEFADTSDIGVHLRDSEGYHWWNFIAMCTVCLTLSLLLVAVSVWYINKRSRRNSRASMDSEKQMLQQQNQSAAATGEVETRKSLVNCPNCRFNMIFRLDGSNITLASVESEYHSVILPAASSYHTSPVPLRHNLGNGYITVVPNGRYRLASTPDGWLPVGRNRSPGNRGLTSIGNGHLSVSQTLGAYDKRSAGYRSDIRSPMGSKQRRLAVSDLDCSDVHQELLPK